MNRPSDELTEIRWVSCKNDSGEIVPAGAVMRVSGYEADTNSIKVAKPNADGQTDVCINGPTPIAVDGYGNCTFDLESGPGTVAYDTADGTPAFDETWGAENGSWKLNSSKGGFRVFGKPTGATGLVIANKSKSSFSGAAIQRCMTSLSGVETLIPFGNTYYNTDNYLSPPLDRFYIDKVGIYRFSYTISFSGSGSATALAPNRLQTRIDVLSGSDGSATDRTMHVMDYGGPLSILSTSQTISMDIVLVPATVGIYGAYIGGGTASSYPPQPFTSGRFEITRLK